MIILGWFSKKRRDRWEQKGTTGTSNVSIDQDFIQSLSPRVKTLTFTGNEFRTVRFLLRLLSLWRPCTAGFLESIIYPFLVNFILLSVGPVRNIIDARGEPTWLSIQSIYVIHEVGIWLGHILGNIYFRSRDLETNVLPEVKPLTVSKLPLECRLKYLKICMVFTLLTFSITLCTLFVVMQLVNNHGNGRFSSSFPHVHGTLDHILYAVVVLSIFYNLGVGLALAWTMGLLYLCFSSRLQTLEGIFLRWKRPMHDAVYFFEQRYSRPLKRSWERITWWFLAHNVIVLAVPLYGYKLAQAFDGVAYDVKHLSEFIVYLAFVFFIWLAPIVLAELIQRRETQFHDAINCFCPGLLKEQLAFGRSRQTPGDEDFRQDEVAISVSSDSSDEQGERCTDNASRDCYTFASRGDDLRNFLRFLRNRTPSLASHGYNWQLVSSFVSIAFGILSFFVTLHRNSERFGHAGVVSGNASVILKQEKCFFC